MTPKMGRLHSIENAGVEIMKSINFEWLRQWRPELASLGGFAEAYAHSDPDSAAIKLRQFCEEVVHEIYSQHHLNSPGSNLYDKIQLGAFRDAVEGVVLGKLDGLRYHGNKGAHRGETKVDQGTVMWLLREAWDLGNWLILTFEGAAIPAGTVFRDPPEGGATGFTKAKLKRDKKELRIELASKDAALSKALEELEILREKEARAELDKFENQQEQQRIVNERRDTGKQAVNALKWDEAETRRRLIDSMLRDAGWNVDDKEQVVLEMPVVGLESTKSGKGKVDYVLLGENGKPIAIIEAKRTSKDADEGKQQAREYAEALEKMHGERPVLFYTNGYETFIWDDQNGYPARRIYGYYSKDSLELLRNQRATRKVLTDVETNKAIAGRDYQLLAIKAVCEHFEKGHRKALIVQATGTGKTRVSIALADKLLSAGWAKRVLFLCDRKELRKQANIAFNDNLDTSLGVIGSGGRLQGSKDKLLDANKRIYIATYPGMLRCFQSIDVGFFDVIIVDESHRSVYNTYRELLEYFDALRIGLTATPVDKIDRNTFELFGCKDGDPTIQYTLENGIKDKFLVPPRVQRISTKFTRGGIKYSELSDEQKRAADEQFDDATAIDITPSQLDRTFFNKASNRLILSNLMEHGQRDASQSVVGKSIIFARSFEHAKFLKKLFDEDYPQYSKGNSLFCEVITSHDGPRAETLIDKFKENDPKVKEQVVIAISVDMLDTGIDVPAIVNLVFAKPVGSPVKFWQMVGRGTRLCEDLFGPGKDKKAFYIFDHWNNFEHFGEVPPEGDPETAPKSLMEQRLIARISLFKQAIEAMEQPIVDEVAELLFRDVEQLAKVNTISVKKHWKEIKQLEDKDRIADFEKSVEKALLNTIGPLLHWVNIKGDEAGLRFDILIAKTQAAALKGKGALEHYQGRVQERVGMLNKNLNQVKAKAEFIKNAMNKTFWNEVSFDALEEIRIELRGIIHNGKSRDRVGSVRKEFDIAGGDVQRHEVALNLGDHEYEGYRRRVTNVLRREFEENQTLAKIKACEPVTDEDLAELQRLVIERDATLDLRKLLVNQPEFTDNLALALRSVVGVDPDEVREHFQAFVAAHETELESRQMQFLQMLKRHICDYGIVSVDTLYDAPFTQLHSEGIDGLFADELVNELLELIGPFELPMTQEQHDHEQ